MGDRSTPGSNAGAKELWRFHIVTLSSSGFEWTRAVPGDPSGPQRSPAVCPATQDTRVQTVTVVPFRSARGGSDQRRPTSGGLLRGGEGLHPGSPGSRADCARTAERSRGQNLTEQFRFRRVPYRIRNRLPHDPRGPERTRADPSGPERSPAVPSGPQLTPPPRSVRCSIPGMTHLLSSMVGCVRDERSQDQRVKTRSRTFDTDTPTN